jgi:hypothetical protein
MEVDNFASDLADKAISPATAQLMTSFFIHPPNSITLSKLNWPDLRTFPWVTDAFILEEME